MANGNLRALVKALVSILAPRPTTTTHTTSTSPRKSTPQATPKWRDTPSHTTSQSEQESPGQFGSSATREMSAAEIAQLTPTYAPAPDSDPDPGEVIWTWVPYAENDGRGKDRPVLIIARIDATNTAGCYLSTKDHDGFISVGTGGWDSQGRESFLNPERVLRINHNGMRREGHVLPAQRFTPTVRAIGKTHGLNW